MWLAFLGPPPHHYGAEFHAKVRSSAGNPQPGECVCPDLDKEGITARIPKRLFSFWPPFHSIEISKEDTRPGLIANERAFNILYDGIRNGKPFVLYVRKKAKATLR